MDLLWENASPEISFVPQTVSLDLSNYKLVLIYFERTTDRNYYDSDITLIHSAGCLIGAGHDTFTYRYYTVNYNGVHFDEAHLLNTPNFNGSNEVNYCSIPINIYGIK